MHLEFPSSFSMQSVQVGSSRHGDPQSCNEACWVAARQYGKYLWMETFVCGLGGARERPGWRGSLG
ncbi:MAG: hypothetical protein ACPGU1_17695 [Myxococcota bacterium]